MTYYLAVYSSVTLANRVKKQVTKDGSYVGLVYTPKCLSKGGCSYALRFGKGKLSEIKSVSQKLDVKIKGIYKEINVNGNKEYHEEL